MYNVNAMPCSLNLHAVATLLVRVHTLVDPLVLLAQWIRCIVFKTFAVSTITIIVVIGSRKEPFTSFHYMVCTLEN